VRCEDYFGGEEFGMNYRAEEEEKIQHRDLLRKEIKRNFDKNCRGGAYCSLQPLGFDESVTLSPEVIRSPAILVAGLKDSWWYQLQVAFSATS
jgi:hypothetical protein